MWKLFKPPVFEDEARTLAARKVWVVLIWTAVAVTVSTLLIHLLAPMSGPRLLFSVFSFDALCLAVLLYLRAGYIRAAAVSLVMVCQLAQLYAAWGAGGILAPVMSASLVIVGIAGILLGAPAAVWAGLSVSACAGFLGWAEVQGWLPAPTVVHSPFTRWMALCAYVFMLVNVQVVVAWVVHKAEALAQENRRKRDDAEQAFRSQTIIHHQMYETSMDAYVRVDLSGRILEFNEVYRKMLGYEAHELSQLSYRDFTPAKWLETEDRIIREQVLVEGFSQIFEKEYRCKDGRVVPVELRVSLLRNRAGSPVSMWAFVRDISERKQAELRLRQSEEKFARAFRCAPVMFSITTLDTGVYLDVNDFALNLGGFTREEVIGKTSMDFGWITKDQRRLLLDFVAKPDRSAGIELVLTAKNGRKIHGLVHVDEILFEGQRCLMCVTVDITERKQLEEQYRQSQKMDAVGQLAGGVAHDFNNILTASMMQLSLLKSEPGLSAGLTQGLEEMRVFHARAARLTRQLLTFSRRQPVRMSLVDLNEVLAQLLSMLGALLGEHIQIETQVAARPLWINADVGMIEQLITNLAVNARDAMQPDGGRLDVQLSAIHVGADAVASNPEAQVGDFASLVMRDSGCGMSVELQARIFEPFFTTKEVGKGTGLGLPTAFGIVHQHGGWIEVESTVGKGSCFTIFLPLHAGAAVPAELAAKGASVPPVSGTATILVVEDEAAVLAATVACLRSRGYRIFTAQSGPEALRVWAQHKQDIELLLTDAVMPEGMTGMALALELRREDPRLKVIVASGYSREINEQGGNRVPEAFYLSKPFELSELLDTIRRVLET